MPPLGWPSIERWLRPEGAEWREGVKMVVGEKSFYLHQRIKATVVEFLKSGSLCVYGGREAFLSEIYYFLRFSPNRLYFEAFVKVAPDVQRIRSKLSAKMRIADERVGIIATKRFQSPFCVAGCLVRESLGRVPFLGCLLIKPISVSSSKQSVQFAKMHCSRSVWYLIQFEVTSCKSEIQVSSTH